MSTGATLIITIPRKSAKHIAIWQYIEQHCDHDGRGIRTQPLVEKLFYECARSGLTPDEVCYAIRAYEASTARSGDAESIGGLRQGAPRTIVDKSSEMLPAIAERPPEIDRDGAHPNVLESAQTTAPAAVVQKPREECIIPLEEDAAMDQDISAETAFSREVVRTMICSVDDTDEVIAKADRIMQDPDVRAFVKDAAAFLTSVRKDRAKDLAESE